MAKYRKKPVVIEAEQMTDDFVTKHFGTVHYSGLFFAQAENGPWYCEIRTLEGTMRADMGDWIITGIKGEKYPCKPDIFAATYEAVEEDMPRETLAEA